MASSEQTAEAQQFGRYFSLIVGNNKFNGLDLSQLRCVFSVKRSGVMTPNVADIKIYNLDANTALTIKKEFSTVMMRAGYDANQGTIFEGSIKQCIIGRENGTDTFLNIIAGDGDQAYNFAAINTTLAAGSSRQDQLNAAFAAMATQGVGQAYVGTLPTIKLPRGKVLYGSARDHIKRVADSSQFDWSIQDGKIVFIKKSTYLPGTAVVLSSKTGMIGTPQQTVQGLNCKCLLNPKIKVHGRIQIDNASVQAFKLDQFNPGTPANTPVPLRDDGFYYVYIAEHSGDTRGTEWYTNLNLLAIDQTTDQLSGVGPT